MTEKRAIPAAESPARRADAEALYLQFHGHLAGYIRRRVPTVDDAEELTQEVCVRILRNLHTIEDADRAPAWMFRIASNAITDFYRARAQEGAVHRDLALQITEIDKPDSVHAAQELARGMAPLVGCLPEEYASVLELTEIRGFTQREAADQLGLSLPALKSRVLRGRQRVRAILEDCCTFELDRRGRVIDYERRDPAQSCGCASDDGTTNDQPSCECT